MTLRPTFCLLQALLWLSLPIHAQTSASQRIDGGMGRNINQNNPSDGTNRAQIEQPDKEQSQKGIDTLRMRPVRIDACLGQPMAADMDTVPLNFQNNSFPERTNTLSATHTGSLGSPFRSKVYTDQAPHHCFIFLHSYEQWLTAPADFVFLNTTKPFTTLEYLTSFGNDQSQEENFRFYTSANLNKHLNIGASYEILYARGFYNRSATRDKLADFFGNYQSERYEAFWKVSFNNLENMENGGIIDDRYITEPLLMSGGLREYESLNIPVHLTNATSKIKNQQLFFNHKYHLGFKRTNEKDSLQTTFVPVTSLIHTLQIDRSYRQYLSESVNLAYFDSAAYIDPGYTADTAALFTVSNTLGLALREGFHDWAQMGLTAFVTHEYKRYTGLSPTAPLRDSSNAFSRVQLHQENLVWGGAELSRQQGKVLTYQARGRICLLGPDMGDTEFSGHLNTRINFKHHPVSLEAGGHLFNNRPDYFLETYHSNHFSWNNHFDREHTMGLYGTLDIPALGFTFKATVDNLTNHVYFNQKALPAQFGGNIQILVAEWKQHLRWGILNWDNHLAYQASSHPDIIPLPQLTAYSNLYMKGYLSKVLLTQVGVDCRYHTAYYAPAYQPATGQFYTQDEVKVGHYPFMNAYANFHLKRARFYVMYAHVSRLFANPTYFSAPHYPMNPAILKVGLSWNFYD